MSGPCRHKTSNDFIVGENDDGRKIWKCEACGSEGIWTDDYTALRNEECKHCELMDFTWVACSDACVSALKKGKIK